MSVLQFCVRFFSVNPERGMQQMFAGHSLEQEILIDNQHQGDLKLRIFLELHLALIVVCRQCGKLSSAFVVYHML